MSQRDALRALDAEILQGLLGAGLADAATFQGPAAGAPPVTPDPIPCTAIVNRNAQFIGDGQAQVAGNRVAITLFLTQVSSPIEGAFVTIGSETFVLDELVERDESQTTWVVVDG